MLSLFTELVPEIQDGRFVVRYDGKALTIYTERSGARSLAEMRAAMANTASSQTLIIVAPYGDALRGLFAGRERFFFLAPVAFSDSLPRDDRLVADDAGLERFVNSVEPEDKFSIYAVPQWQNAHDYVMAGVQQILARAAIRLKTIGHFEKLWQVNFRLNAEKSLSYGDIASLARHPPDALVMAGPSLDTAFAALRDCRAIWCADTALPALAARGVLPQAVFSVDAGFASQEHFVGSRKTLEKSLLVCDILGNAAVQRLAFSQKLTYAASHPLVHGFCAVKRPALTPVENPAGDVGSLMRVVHQKLFGSARVLVFGHDGGHRKYVTHARGTAYFRRSHAAMTRLMNVETYMQKLSRRYG